MSTPIRLLITNGCSYTRGAELPEPESQSWSAVLAAQIGVPLVNLASDGGSNRRMVRTTMENANKVCQERGVAASECAVVIMWTGLARAEMHLGLSRDRGHRPNLQWEDVWHRLGRWRITEGDIASEVYFRHVWSERGAAIELFLDWVLLDAYLWRHGFTTRYAYAWDVLPKRLPREARTISESIDPAVVFGGVPADSTASFYGLVHRDFPTGTLFHPLAEGHAFLGRRMAEWMTMTSRASIPIKDKDS